MDVLEIIGWALLLVVVLGAAMLVGGLTARLFIRATADEEATVSEGGRSPEGRSR